LLLLRPPLAIRLRLRHLLLLLRRRPKERLAAEVSLVHLARHVD
jgi:hypothetical protein